MFRKLLPLCLALSMMLTPIHAVLAAKTQPSPTPPPVQTRTAVLQPPEEIRQMLDLAYHEWEELAASGRYLENKNKYTKWRTSGGFGWCGGFVTWCMLEIGIPMAELEEIPEQPKEGLYHVKEASVGKIQRGYMKMGRACIVPQPGFLVVYAVRKSTNDTTHIGIVYDVEDLGNGKYRLTTIEGNMSKRVKMYVHDYDMYAEDWTHNLSEIPKEEQTRQEDAYFNYRLQMDTWYINRFLMPWMPDESTPAKPETTAAPSPMPSPAPEVPETTPNATSTSEMETPAPTAVATTAPTAAPTAVVTATPTLVPTPTQTPAVTSTPQPTPTPTLTATVAVESTQTPIPLPGLF